MFVCEKCLEKYEPITYYPMDRSYGPCEVCGETTLCVDVRGGQRLVVKKEE